MAAVPITSMIIPLSGKSMALTCPSAESMATAMVAAEKGNIDARLTDIPTVTHAATAL